MVEDLRKRSMWEKNDFICRGHIFSGMVSSLFVIYQHMESAKDLWNLP